MGYKIVDLNYPTLAALVSDPNRWNALQLSQYLCHNTADQAHENICYAIMGFEMNPGHDQNLQYLDNAVTELGKMAKQFYDDMSNLCQDFDHCKLS